MKWGRQPYTLQPSYASERTWIACRKWSWRAAYFGGDTLDASTSGDTLHSHIQRKDMVF